MNSIRSKIILKQKYLLKRNGYLILRQNIFKKRIKKRRLNWTYKLEMKLHSWYSLKSKFTSGNKNDGYYLFIDDFPPLTVVPYIYYLGHFCE
jgi:hypothetical protein